MVLSRIAKLSLSIGLVSLGLGGGAGALAKQPRVHQVLPAQAAASTPYFVQVAPGITPVTPGLAAPSVTPLNPNAPGKAGLPGTSMIPGLASPNLSAPTPVVTLQTLPPEVEAALARANIPQSAVSMVVADASGHTPARLSFRPAVPMNPASVMKLITTYAALDTLKPSFTWKTHVSSDAAPVNMILPGNLIIRGAGDPKLVVERLKPMMERVMASGVKVIQGDIVLDRSAFKLPNIDPGQFDGEPLAPYNARPDALLINFKSMVMTFTPNPAQGVATVKVDPPLAGVAIDTQVPLAKDRPCGEWQDLLETTRNDPTRLHFAGSYSAACGEQTWASAYPDPASHAARAIEGMWRSLGGDLLGTVRDASAQELMNLHKNGTLTASKPTSMTRRINFDAPSLTLGEIVHDVNKFSNNVMAQHVFLSLGLYGNLGQTKEGTLEASRMALRNWWRKNIPASTPPIMENGSGLSRIERVTAQGLASLLQSAARNPVHSVLFDSLPTSGADGTMRNRAKEVTGQAHIKTGTLGNATAIAGYTNNVQGRQVVVGIINHANAIAGRPALDALIAWAVKTDALKPSPSLVLTPASAPTAVQSPGVASAPAAASKSRKSH